MVQFNPQFVKNAKGKTIVLLKLTRAEYRRVCELLEDAVDVAEYTAAKKHNGSRRWYTLEEARQQLGITGRGTRSKPVARKSREGGKRTKSIGSK